MFSPGMRFKTPSFYFILIVALYPTDLTFIKYGANAVLVSLQEDVKGDHVKVLDSVLDWCTK